MKSPGKGIVKKKGKATLRDVFSLGTLWAAATELLTGHKAVEAMPRVETVFQPGPAFGFATLSGRVIDGYVKDGTVFYDDRTVRFLALV